MLAQIAILAALAAVPEIPIRPGKPIVLDGKIEAAEWADAFRVTAKAPGGERTYELRLKRVGAELALAASGGQTYGAEVLRIEVADAAGQMMSSLVLGLGNPESPPDVWRRGVPRFIDEPRPRSSRACRVRLSVARDGSWSAEYLLRLSALGIGRGDLREFLGAVTLSDRRLTLLATIPKNLKDLADLSKFAKLRSADRWGATETWAPPSKEASREYDDGALLIRLFSEHEKISAEEVPDQIVIANAIRPLSQAKVEALQTELEAGRARNPTLPAWSYYLARLMHEANRFDDARAILATVPGPLLETGPFVGLLLDHYVDLSEWDKAQDLAEKHPHARNARSTLGHVAEGRKMAAAEAAARAADAEKREKNPVVVIKTDKGDIVCELFEDDAPFAVRNFMDLVLREKYYDRMRFHRVEGGQLAQAGDPRTRPGARGRLDGPEWRVKPDPPKRSTLRGMLGVVPAAGGVSHGSQFVILVGHAFRSRQLVVFGRVVKGMDVVDRLEQDDRIESIRVAKDESGKEMRRNHGYQAAVARLK